MVEGFDHNIIGRNPANKYLDIAVFFGEVAEWSTNLPGADLNKVAKQLWPCRGGVHGSTE
jgi:hypothetical protein